MNEGAMQERIVLCRTLDEIQALLERFHMVLPSLKRGKAFLVQQWQKSSFSTERSFLYRKMAGQWALRRFTATTMWSGKATCP